MKAQKVTVNIQMEALSLDCLKGLLYHVIEEVERGAESGSLIMDDGDQIGWNTERKEVKF